MSDPKFPAVVATKPGINNVEPWTWNSQQLGDSLTARLLSYYFTKNGIQGCQAALIKLVHL